MISEDAKLLQTDTKYKEIEILIKDFLNKLTVHFDSVETVDGDAYPVIHITTNDSGILIGNSGESLRAFNHIIKGVVTKKFSKDKSQFLLDVNDYYKKKITTLKSQAEVLAQRARMFKSDIEMNPVNSYERMIVHSMFVNDSEIKTESVGIGKTRRVVFKYITSSKQSPSDIL